MKDNLYTGEHARSVLMNGVKKISDAVGVTMGTSGSNSLIECIENPQHYSTNDGFTIANSIKLENPLEEMGRKVLLEAINRANKSSGDGSSTTCVLTSAILDEGMKHIGEKSPMEIKRSLEVCIPLIEASINGQKRDVSVENVADVASISAEDSEIGERIQEIYKQIGKEGIIYWDVSKTEQDFYSIGSGLTINGATYASPYMGDMVSPTEFSTIATMKNPRVLLVRNKITSGEDFGNLFQKLYIKEIKEIVLFCDEIEIPAIVHFILTQQQRGFRTLVIKMPTLWKDEWWQDLALTSGATIVDALSGIKIKEIEEKHLGTFGNIRVTKEDTYIDGIKDVSAHIEELKKDGSDASLFRASRLNVKTARYFVGAPSESALAYRRLKVEDAINAASCALDNGIVAGGGIALLNASNDLQEDTIGAIILKEALKRPFHQIMENYGKLDASIEGNAKTLGFDTRTGQIVNMFDAGIVDPADVVMNAVKNAIGVAATILTIGNVIILPREDENTRQMPAMQ